MQFFLGSHLPSWLAFSDVPLFISRNRFNKKKFPRALSPWALDSGAFTEISTHGKWTVTCRQYAVLARRYRDEVGNMLWAAPQDWMCEPFIIEKTGLSVSIHQRKTVINYLALMECAPDVPWIPVLQGWTLGDYKNHMELYERYRVNLKDLPVVGLGSVCRRQDTSEAAEIVRCLNAYGLKLHGFGFKLTGLAAVGKLLESSDSMAWSYSARRLGRRWCENGNHANCANCWTYARHWRDRAVSRSSMCEVQDSLFAYV